MRAGCGFWGSLLCLELCPRVHPSGPHPHTAEVTVFTNRVLTELSKLNKAIRVGPSRGPHGRALVTAGGKATPGGPEAGPGSRAVSEGERILASACVGAPPCRAPSQDCGPPDDEQAGFCPRPPHLGPQELPLTLQTAAVQLSTHAVPHSAMCAQISLYVK